MQYGKKQPEKACIKGQSNKAAKKNRQAALQKAFQRLGG
jgi:hypothetical protein